jgi:hypothetical protein
VTEPTVDAVIAKYVELRDRKAAIEQETKDRLFPINEAMGKLEAYILQIATATGVDSFKTPHGTAYLSRIDTARVSDWEAVLAYITEEQRWDMLTQGVNKSVVREILDSVGHVPPGVDFSQRINVNVRRPSAKVE